MLAATLVLLVSHGGGSMAFRSGGVPPGHVAPEAISPTWRFDCVCSKKECTFCTPRTSKRFRYFRDMEITKRWGDIAYVAVTYCFETVARDNWYFAVVPTEPGPVFAPVCASIRRGRRYLKVDCVPLLESAATGNGWKALVAGNPDKRVRRVRRELLDP